MEKHNEEWIDEMKKRSVAVKNAMEHFYEAGRPGILFKEGEELIGIAEGYLREIETREEEIRSALNDLKAFLEG